MFSNIGRSKLQLVVIIILLPVIGCASAQNFKSTESFSGGLFGGLAGAGVGYLLGEELGAQTENVILSSAIGAGLGLLTGALLHERNVEVAKQREMVLREAKLISETQHEIDSLRRKVYDSSSWGRNEVRPWNERFQSDQPNIPYQSTGDRVSPGI